LPALGTSLKALDLDAFRLKYLPAAIDPDTLAENGRSIEQQLASLRFYDLNTQTPTNAGILLLGKNPEFPLPGAYIQYIKFTGDSMLSDVLYEKKFTGALIYELKVLDDFIKGNIIKERPVKRDSFQEELIRNYPYWALRELLMNAIMHRNYESNAPIYIYEYAEHIEIVNPGGLFGEATPQNFPNASDYRNIVVAESLRILGFVNRFNYGVKRAIHELLQNGNGEPEFDLTLQTKFKVNIKVRKDWLK
jgi:ATP-dependent DNA helicase RecG